MKTSDFTDSGHNYDTNNRDLHGTQQFYIWISVFLFVLLFVRLVRIREKHAQKMRARGQSLIDKSNQLETSLMSLRKTHGRKVNNNLAKFFCKNN